MQNTDKEKDIDGPKLPTATYGRLTVLTTQTTQTVRFERFLSGPQGPGEQSPASTDSDSYDSDEVRHNRFAQMARPTNHPVFSPVNPRAPTVPHKVWPEGLIKDKPKSQCCVIM